MAAYKWNPEAGKYEADTDNDVAGEGSLDGEFTIVITNQSNVGIDYTVEYTANTAAIFATAAAEDWENAEGTVDTVAKGQEIGDTGITITNVTEAIAGDTSFKTATCTGSITVTGINEGKTPSTETGSTDTLGTFKVTISEAPVVDPTVFGYDVTDDVTSAYVLDISSISRMDMNEFLDEFVNMLGHMSLAEVLNIAEEHNGVSATALETEEKIPADEFVILTIGDYLYYSKLEFDYEKEVYCVTGWGVSVIDKNKTSYSDILTSIAGMPIVSLQNTFFECENLTVAPKLPNGVKLFAGIFQWCPNLESVPYPIDVAGANTYGMFSHCEKLNGEIVLNGTPGYFYSMFDSAVTGDNRVVLSGTCDSDVLAQIAAQNDNVSVKGN